MAASYPSVEKQPDKAVVIEKPVTLSDCRRSALLLFYGMRRNPNNRREVPIVHHAAPRTNGDSGGCCCDSNGSSSVHHFRRRLKTCVTHPSRSGFFASPKQINSVSSSSTQCARKRPCSTMLSSVGATLLAHIVGTNRFGLAGFRSYRPRVTDGLSAPVTTPESRDDFLLRTVKRPLLRSFGPESDLCKTVFAQASVRRRDRNDDQNRA